MNSSGYVKTIEYQPTLMRLDMELTERCNNDCIHCCIAQPAADEEVHKRELSTQEIEDILNEAASLGCLTVRYTGGEPLLRQDFEELYLFARRLGLKIEIFTNATLLTERLARLFARFPPLEKVEVTLYGIKPGSYEAVTRVPGSFEAAIRGVSLLRQYGIPFIVKGGLLPRDLEEMAEFNAFSLRIPWMQRPATYSIFLELRVRRDSEVKNRVIRRLRPSPEEVIHALSRDRGRYLKEMRHFCHKFIGPHGDTLFPCGAGLNIGCVDAYGHYQLCALLKHPSTAYDLRQGSLKEAVTAFAPTIRESKASDSDYLKRCARCFLKGLCEQCPGRSWIEHGVLDAPVEYLCEAAHAEARYLGLIAENERGWNLPDWKERVAMFCKGDLWEQRSV